MAKIIQISNGTKKLVIVPENEIEIKQLEEFSGCIADIIGTNTKVLEMTVTNGLILDTGIRTPKKGSEESREVKNGTEAE